MPTQIASYLFYGLSIYMSTFFDNTILTQFHLINKEKTGNRMDTCLLLFTRIIMTRFLIVNSTILPSRYVIPFIIKDTGFDLKRVQVKKKMNFF